MEGDRLSRILAELSAEGGGRWASARLCEAAREIIGVSGAGVMLMSGDVPGGSLCTTGGVSSLIEELQYTLGEGPCVDAFRQDRVVLEPDLAHPGTPRWLAFTPRRWRRACSAQRTPMDDSNVLVAQAFADLATISILQQRATVEAQQVNEQLAHALTSRIVIEQAKGVVFERAGIDIVRGVLPVAGLRPQPQPAPHRCGPGRHRRHPRPPGMGPRSVDPPLAGPQGRGSFRRRRGFRRRGVGGVTRVRP